MCSNSGVNITNLSKPVYSKFSLTLNKIMSVTLEYRIRQCEIISRLLRYYDFAFSITLTPNIPGPDS